MEDHGPVAVGDAPPQGDLVELSRSACLALLSTARIGRVIYTDAALPAALPVTYALDDEEVVFRTNGGGRLAAATRNAVVGFQVDELDWVTRTGWTVLGVGEAYEVTEPRRLAALRGRLPQPWVPGHVDHTTCIPLQRLTGRRIVAGHGSGARNLPLR
jgi:nitroimidazol reductase NimA-like FMN-containing flavoprotein (pyridoxamine 5'-phosphate oxidase superfamily)